MFLSILQAIVMTANFEIFFKLDYGGAVEQRKYNLCRDIKLVYRATRVQFGKYLKFRVMTKVCNIHNVLTLMKSCQFFNSPK